MSNCVFCKKEIIGRYKNAIYCSDKCKRRAFYLKNRNQQIEQSLINYYLVLRPMRLTKKRICKHCGSEFVNLGNGLYCATCRPVVSKIRTRRNMRNYQSKLHYGAYWQAHRAMRELDMLLKTTED